MNSTEHKFTNHLIVCKFPATEVKEALKQIFK